MGGLDTITPRADEITSWRVYHAIKLIHLLEMDLLSMRLHSYTGPRTFGGWAMLSRDWDRRSACRAGAASTAAAKRSQS